jgi:hypothetical protein
MVGPFAINTDAKYIDPLSGIRRKKSTKTNRSPFMNKVDAEKQYITGEMDNSGKKKSRIEEKIDNRIKGL